MPRWRGCSAAERRRQRHGAAPWRPLALGLVLVLAGCGVRPPTTGVVPGGKGAYASVAVAPLLADEVRLMARGTFSSETSKREAAGWDARGKADAIASEILGPAGTQVTPVHDVPALVGAAAGEKDWARQTWEKLRAANRLGGAQAVLLLRENAIDWMGRQYNPARDFLATGLIGLAVGAANREELYQPGFLLVVQSGIDAAFGAPSKCDIGFDAVLLDAATGNQLAKADAVLGEEAMPDTFKPRTWEAATPEERAAAETYCIAALRRGMAQAIGEVGLVRQP